MNVEQSGFPNQTALEAFRELEHNGDMYRLLVENSLGLVCAHDLNGELLTVNLQAARALDYTPDELIGRRLYDLVDPAVQPLFARYLRRVRTQREASGELRLVKRSGGVVTWSYRNSLYRCKNAPDIVIGHAIDVTAHLELEHSLKESREQYRRLFEDAPVAYHEIDREGLIVRVNKAECQLLGWNKDEMLGRPVWDFISSGQKETSKSHVKRKLSGDQLLVPFYRDYVRKDGERLTFLIHENLIHRHTGEIAGIRSALLDVTEQNRAEAELRRVNEELDKRIEERTAELERSNQRLSEFVHMISHDLQEPLRSTSSFSTLLCRRYGHQLDEEGRGFLDHIVSTVGRMAKLLQDLLDYSRNTAKEVEVTAVDLNVALDAALANLRGAMEKNGARIEREVLPVVNSQFTQMMQLFQNLIDNALKYRSERPPVISISVQRENDYYAFSVTDNGIGIPEKDRERVFGLFSRSQDVGSNGSGVGLAICKAIVERHRGRIWIEPGTREGCTFRFTLED